MLSLLPPDPVQWAWGIVLFWLVPGIRVAAAARLAAPADPAGVSAGCAGRTRHRRRRGCRHAATGLRRHPADRPARPAFPSAAGCPVRLLHGAAGRRGVRHHRLRLRLFQEHGCRPAGAAGPVVPPVPGGHGHRAAGRRRLRLHGGLGSDGAVVLLPRHHRPQGSRNPPRRLPLSADRARRRGGAAAHLRRAAGRPRRLHLRHHAAGRDDAVLGLGRVPAGAVRLRRQGGPGADARVAAGSAPGRALAGVRADVGGDAEDRHLRSAAGDLRSAQYPDRLVGHAGAGARFDYCAVRRDLRRRAVGHEAAPGLVVDREHRHPDRRFRPHADLLHRRQGRAGGADAHRDALPRPQPCLLQGSAVRRHRLGAARHRGAPHGPSGRPDALHAVDGLADPDRRAGHRRAAAV